MQLVWRSWLSVNRVPRERLTDAVVCWPRCWLRLPAIEPTFGAPFIARFAIRSLPRLVPLLRGQVLGRFSGAVPASQLLDWLEQSLAEQSEAS